MVHANQPADAIGTICRRFPDEYAGHVLDRDRGIVKVYVTREGSGELVHALSTDMGPAEAGGYEVVRATHTFAALKGLTARIGRRPRAARGRWPTADPVGTERRIERRERQAPWLYRGSRRIPRRAVRRGVDHGRSVGGNAAPTHVTWRDRRGRHQTRRGTGCPPRPNLPKPCRSRAARLCDWSRDQCRLSQAGELGCEARPFARVQSTRSGSLVVDLDPVGVIG